MAGSVRDALRDAGVDLTAVDERDAEIKRLTKIVREQGAEVRRLRNAWQKLKDEKRQAHEFIAMMEQLQEDIERLEDSVAFYESDRITQALDNTRRSRDALGIRYGALHGALRALLADPAARERAERALRCVDDGRWVRAQLEARFAESPDVTPTSTTTPPASPESAPAPEFSPGGCPGTTQ